MNLVYLNMLIESEFKDMESYTHSSQLPQTVLGKLQDSHSFNISVVQRATFNKNIELDGVSFNFIKDEFPGNLRWWQEPESIIQSIADIETDIIYVRGLNLPLQFRWLRRIVGGDIVIIGEHTGEDFWAQRNLWLQQFGLRVVDGFIFQNLDVAKLWKKTSLVLENQPVIEITSFSENPENTAEMLVKFFNQLVKINK